MTNLNRHILKWRLNLLMRGAFQKSDIDELESHLRDEIDELQRLGYSDEDAFHLAVRRLGDLPGLQEEFSKVNFGILWLKRAAWSVLIVMSVLLLFTQCSVHIPF